MARPLQVLSLLSRLGALSVIPSASLNGCRFASRGASKAWVGQSIVHRDRVPHRASRHRDELSDEEGLADVEDVEDKLQALDNEGRKRQKILKYHILRRQMTPPGAPQRKLTWDAIEQIRYLKQEQPDEWTVERLAEGFSVTPDVILRVLRNKFVPTAERKARQDAKVLAELSQQGLPSGAGRERVKLPGSSTPAVLLPGSKEDAVEPVAEQTLMLRGEGSRSLAESPAPVTALPAQLRASINKDALVTTSREEDSAATVEVIMEEESWDGWVLTDEELEEFMGKKPSSVVQVGKDFFDADGNFLYRIT
ncbi:neugrin [Morone saxatilis]|uniref:neugrin n=1 Tax=Morone saxatilis TaxID=34816 RepID=UPI0015E1FAC7|nr:neugrin [Morone saxatilis]